MCQNYLQKNSHKTQNQSLNQFLNYKKHSVAKPIMTTSTQINQK